MEPNTSTDNTALTEANSIKEIPSETESKSGNIPSIEETRDRNTTLPVRKEQDQILEDNSPESKAIQQSLKEKNLSMEDISALQEETGALQEETGKPQEETGVPQEKTGILQEGIGKLQEEPGKLQEEPGALQEEPGKLQEGLGKLQEELGKHQEEPGKHQEGPGKPQEETGYQEKLRILTEKKQSRKKIPVWKEKLSSKPEGPTLKKASEEKKELKTLLKADSPGDPGKRTKADSNDEVIALNDQVKFIFKDENTIIDSLLSGKPGARNSLRRQKLQCSQTKERLDLYMSLIEPFVTISRKDYFLLFLKLKSELKFRRAEINPLCKYLNVLLFTLVNEKFTYDDITSCLKISGGQLKRMIAKMKDLNWIKYHNARTERYYYLAQTGLQLLKDAVEKKTPGD